MALVRQYSGPLMPGINLSSTREVASAEELAELFQELLAGKHPIIYQRFGTELINKTEQTVLSFEKDALDCLLFRSGMAAITTAIHALVDPREHPIIIHTEPLYGCTFEYIQTICPKSGCGSVAVTMDNLEEVLTANGSRVGCIVIEHPSNPVISLTDLDAAYRLREEYSEVYGYRPPIIVDSTFLSPLYCHPFEHGADAVIHSATKYLGGHSDILAGVIMTKTAGVINEIRRYRNVLGNIIDEVSAYLLFHSLETLRLRVPAQVASAQQIAIFLANHPAVEKVMYPGLLTAESDGKLYDIFSRTCDGPGSMISIYLKDPSRAAAFRVIDAVRVFHRAVSLGGTHSLIEHPASTTHAGVPEEARIGNGITENLIRLSIGVEPVEELITDLTQALEAV